MLQSLIDMILYWLRDEGIIVHPHGKFLISSLTSKALITSESVFGLFVRLVAITPTSLAAQFHRHPRKSIWRNTKDGIAEGVHI